MATKANINIDQGTTFNTLILLTDDAGNPLDMSAYSANAQIRKWYSSVTSTPFDVALANGQISLSMNADTTSSLAAGRYLYDVIVTDIHDTVTRIVEGQVTVNPAITRSNAVVYYYTLNLANVNQAIYAGDLVYQSNGVANVTGIVYETLGPDYSGGGNNVIIKLENTTGPFTISNTALIYDSNTSANGIITAISQSVTR